MSEQEQERPLTRRELRLREQAASENSVSAEEVAELDTEIAAEAEGAPADAVEHADISVDIDPLNEDGTPRTRREIRELRAAAIAAILAERGENPAEEADAEADREVPHRAHRPGGDHRTEVPEAEGTVEAEAETVEETEVVEEAQAIADEAGDDEAAVESAEEIIDGAPTEAFTLAELLEASEPTSPTGDAEAVANLFADDEPGSEVDTEDAAAEETDSEAPVIDEQPVDADDAIDVLADEGEELPVIDTASTNDEPALTAVLEAVDAENDEEMAVEEVAVVAEETAVVLEEAEADTEAGEDEKSKGSDTAGYSFPDIQPPEEWRSVFDDPSRAAKIGSNANSESSDFDDLITRAVAQEGSTGGTGASALILPTHPADTAGLSGPLGATGELFVTGSIELPKSLGETGGHAALHDSVEFDAFLTGEQPAAAPAAEESGPMPVSALSAVSARRRPEVPVVAEPAKERSKLPLVLALSGGGLIVVLAGAVIYAASQGVFG